MLSHRNSSIEEACQKTASVSSYESQCEMESMSEQSEQSHNSPDNSPNPAKSVNCNCECKKCKDRKSLSEPKKKRWCRLCKNHGKYVPTKGHKYLCKYTDCDCPKCLTTMGLRRKSACQTRENRWEKTVDDLVMIGQLKEKIKLVDLNSNRNKQTTKKEPRKKKNVRFSEEPLKRVTHDIVNTKEKESSNSSEDFKLNLADRVMCVMQDEMNSSKSQPEPEIAYPKQLPSGSNRIYPLLSGLQLPPYFPSVMPYGNFTSPPVFFDVSLCRSYMLPRPLYTRERENQDAFLQTFITGASIETHIQQNKNNGQLIGKALDYRIEALLSPDYRKQGE